MSEGQCHSCGKIGLVSKTHRGMEGMEVWLCNECKHPKPAQSSNQRKAEKHHLTQERLFDLQTAVVEALGVFDPLQNSKAGSKLRMALRKSCFNPRTIINPNQECDARGGA